MKKLATLLICGMLAFGSTNTVYAASLDDVIGTNQTQEQNTNTQNDNQSNTTNTTEASQPAQNSTATNTGVTQSQTTPQVNTNSNFSSELIGATDFNETDPISNSVNAAQKKIAGIIIQVLGYFITVGLSIRLIIDAAYLAIPFSRVWLANGKVPEQPQQQQGGFGGGYGQGGFGGGGFGGGYGQSGFGGGYGQGGFGGGGFGQQQQQPQGNPFKIQFVSDEAFNAVAKAQAIDPNTGKKGNVFKIYAKDMIVIGILTPVLIVLSLTGAMTQLGFLLGGVVVDTLSRIGTMF